ncbi:MAG: sugar ABC transporter ATP-binding protein [Christensenellales bacterium]|jgi:ribose transport system ATP-binding protein
MSGKLLEARGVQKFFPGVHALDDARFDLEAGEVHALVGENGAGKSTLMKVLTGALPMDAGEIRFEGAPIVLHNVRDAQALGISIIHQERNLMKDLTVAQNIFIGREPMRGALIDKKMQNIMARELLDSLGIDIPPTVPIGALTVAKQQMVEIAKALSFPNTKALIMDEPTSPLTETEIVELFAFIRDLKARGVGIVYISHRLEELHEIADRVTVMRDGKYVGTRVMAEATLPEIISMMVGRVIYEEPKVASAVPADAPVVLEARGLRSREVLDVSFSLRRGEILGLAGLVGAGRTETARLICGADRRTGGEIWIGGARVNIKTPTDAVRAGVGYLSEDRKLFGLCLGLAISDNIALPSLDELSDGAIVDDRAVQDCAQMYKEALSIKAPTIATRTISLSGGNQQKVVVAKWLARECDILIFDEPTRGIDVGAKSEIYKLMNQLTAQGKSIIMISSEMPELLRMSDRIVVMCEGRKTGEIGIEDATQEKIMALATMRAGQEQSRDSAWEAVRA